MYSRKRYTDDADRHFDDGYGTIFEDEELCVYNLPPRYDGSRFRRRNVDENCRRDEKQEAIVTEQHPSDVSKTEAYPLFEDVSEKPCNSSNEGILRFLEGIGGEELLIISLILTVAGGDNSGELLLFLIILLLHG